MTFMDAETYLVKLISSRAYTKMELRKKLEEKNYQDSDKIEKLLDQYEEYGYINDHAYAKLYVTCHEQWGRLKLVDKMRQKGLDRNVIDIALDESGFDETENAMQVSYEMLQKGEPVKRIYSRLLSRGFTSSSVREGVRKAMESSGIYSDGN